MMAPIAGAAAIVAGKVRADHFAARHAAALEQLLRGEQHAGRAVAALQRVALLECLLQVGELAGIGDALDGVDARAVALHGEHQAAAHDHAVDAHRAGAADAVLAADMAAGEGEVLAQEVDQRLACVDGLAHLLAVHRHGDVMDALGHDRGSSNCRETRRSSTPARCFFTAPVACTSSGGLKS
jgi:hypothetical protein